MLEIHKLYHKYEHLADIYASKVFNLSSISYTKEDIKQDFREKLFKVIVSYVKQFAKFKRGERNRPIPIEYNLRAAMSNFVVDFIKKTNTRKHNGWNTYISTERDSFDLGEYEYLFETDCATKLANFKLKDHTDDFKLLINGYDILSGLNCEDSRKAFILRLKGFKFKTIDQVLGIKSSKIVKEHIELLKEKKGELLDFSKEEFLYFRVEED